MSQNMKIQQFFNVPLAKKKEVVQQFAQIDEKLTTILKLIQGNSDFLTPQFLDFYMMIASGNARFRSFFSKEIRNRRNLKSKMRGGFTPDDRKFLLSNFFILQASIDNKVDLLDSRFNRFVRHSIVEDFLRLASGYIEHSENVARSKYDNLAKVEHIEENLAMKNHGLYGLVRMIEHEYKEFLALREKIVEPYFRFVYSLAVKFSQTPIQKEENFQAGSAGLLHAVLMYDSSQSSSSFGNYVKFWIRLEIMKCVYSSSCTIKIPNYTWQEYSKLENKRAGAKSLDDLSNKTNISKEKINVIYERILLSQVQSLDAMLENNEEAEIMAPTTETLELDCLDNLNHQEKFLIGVLYAQYHLVENHIDPSQVESEKLRQCRTVN